jgi:LPS-assembly protein
MQSERHELFGSSGYGPVSFSGSYLYADGVKGSAYPDSREEISVAGGVALNDNWYARGATNYNLSSNDAEKGLTTASFGLDYTHECYNASVTAFRDLRDESSGAGGTTIMFRIGFKNLGDYESSAFSFGGDDE